MENAFHFPKTKIWQIPVIFAFGLDFCVFRGEPKRKVAWHAYVCPSSQCHGIVTFFRANKSWTNVSYTPHCDHSRVWWLSPFGSLEGWVSPKSPRTVPWGNLFRPPIDFLSNGRCGTVHPAVAVSREMRLNPCLVLQSDFGRSVRGDAGFVRLFRGGYLAETIYLDQDADTLKVNI